MSFVIRVILLVALAATSTASRAIAGKRADLVILSANPLTVPPATIETIRVEETIKDGVSEE